jgi:hypothetical protein
MASLKRILADLDPFCLLRDRDGVVRPVCRILEVDGDLDPGRYMRTGIAEVRIHAKVNDSIDPEPAFVQIKHVGIEDVVRRLSASGCAYLAPRIEVAALRARQVASDAKRYLLDVPIAEMEGSAIQGIFAVALARDRDKGSYTDEAAVWEFVDSQARDAARFAQRKRRELADGALDNAQGRVRYAKDCLEGLRTLAGPLRADTIDTLSTSELRSAALRLATELLGVLDRLIPSTKEPV